MLSPSAVVKSIKSSFTLYTMDNKTLYIPAKDREGTLTAVFGMFMTKGAKRVKHPSSQLGAVQIGSVIVLSTRLKYVPNPPKFPNTTNPSVNNRLAFATMLEDVVMNTLSPLNVNIVGNAKLVVRGVSGVRIDGTGISDFSLIQGTKRVPVSINSPRSPYRINLTGKYIDIAEMMLEKAVMDGDLDAEMNGNRMTLNTTVVTRCGTTHLRELLFRDINNGFGVFGDFTPKHFEYDGKTNTLTIKTDRVFQRESDLTGNYTPYFVIKNDANGKIGELHGLSIDLVHKSGLPNQITEVNL